MNDKVQNKLDNIINNLENNIDIKRLKVLKTEVNSNTEIRTLVNHFNSLISQNDYNNDELISVKYELFNNPLFSEYKAIENNLSYFIMYFNNKLSSLVEVRKCRL